MERDLALDPEQLQRHARRLTAALDGLAVLPEPGPDAAALLAATPAGRVLLAEFERVIRQAARAGRELSELAVVLDSAAAAVARADSDTALALHRLAGELS